MTNFRMVKEESSPHSPLLEGGNTSNDYVAKSAQRHRFSIEETVHETLSAVSIQVALWVFISTFLNQVQAAYKAAFDADLGDDMLGFDNSFTNFTDSAIFTSLVAGVL